MNNGRTRNRGGAGRAHGMGVAMRVITGAAAVALGGCSGADVLKLPGLGSSTVALNVPERPEPPEREVSPADKKIARARLGEAATLAAARGNPGDVEATVAAARILRRQGDKSGALALLDQAASAAPNDARLFRDRGLLALELGAVGRARDHLQHAIASGSRDWQTHSALGTALAASGKQKEAQREFAEALKRAPDNPVVLNNLALSLALDGQRGDAEQMLRRASAAKDKASEVRVAQNLALLGKIGETGRKTGSKPDDAAASKQSAVVAPKIQASAKAGDTSGALKTARAD
jgi:Flp pilus assembly protein TadD